MFKVFSQDRVQQHRGEQETEVPKISSKTKSCSQILDVPVPHVPEQLEEVPNMVSPDRIQAWTAEQIVDMSVPKVVEEHVGITKVSSRRGQQRFEEQCVGR